MTKSASKNSGLVPREEEKKLQEEGLKGKHTHPKKSDQTKNQDPNGMTAKTLAEMKKKLREVPNKSAATEHDKNAYNG